MGYIVDADGLPIGQPWDAHELPCDADGKLVLW